MRSAAGFHLPADVIREHLRHTEAEAEPVFSAAIQAAEQRGVALETRLETGSLDRLPAILARIARNADLIVVGEPNPAESGTDETALVEAAFMDTGWAGSPPYPKPSLVGVFLSWVSASDLFKAARFFHKETQRSAALA